MKNFPSKSPTAAINSLAAQLDRAGATSLVHEKHPGSICVINYKGGVGKTTVTALLGIYLSKIAKKKVLLFDIDPQCSLSLALGFDPEEVSNTELTVFNLVEPKAWTKLKNKKLENYVQRPKSSYLPANLHAIPGSFHTDELDYTIAKTLLQDEQRYLAELFLYAKQLLMAFSEEYDYVLVDCPPNKMFLTQAMLRACSFYLPVTIPDQISIYGMPRLIRWVCQIDPPGDRPKLLGYVLNALNRTGGGARGTGSQQRAQHDLLRNVRNSLTQQEKNVLGDTADVGVIPRLDVIARFLGEDKSAIRDFSKRTSQQPSVDECLISIRDAVANRIDSFHAK
jgi:cellulose biosynthesis protein BcsQ